MFYVLTHKHSVFLSIILIYIYHRLSSLSHPLLQCGSYEYVSHPLRLGDLKGNHFDLRITEVQLEEQDKTSANDTCRTKGIFQDSIRVRS